MKKICKIGNNKLMQVCDMPPYQTVSVLSSQESIQDAHAKILQLECVIDARLLQTDQVVLCAILPAPIYTKTQRDALKSQVQLILTQAFGKQIVVTLDNEVYRKCLPDLDDEQAQALITLAMGRI